MSKLARISKGHGAHNKGLLPWFGNYHNNENELATQRARKQTSIEQKEKPEHHEVGGPWVHRVWNGSQCG